jgi:tRNA (mo5U34)-methyltransferase
MVESSLQKRIDEIQWYHEFDFGGGLKAQSFTRDVASHRKVWRFIEQQLEAVDFHGKTVLEIGAWDGYWSFFAERKGAKHVLASEDMTQNWSDGRGLPLAKELLQSSVCIDQNLSVYRLASLSRKFDVIMCLGVYYHLLDPFYAFAQIRHCCHPGTLVLLEGNVGRAGIRADEVRYTFGDTRLSAFIPSAPALQNLLMLAYLRVQSQVWLRPGPFRIVKGLAQHLRRFKTISTTFIDRAFTVCTPFEGVNAIHTYEPPFKLGDYDDRFRRSASAVAECSYGVTGGQCSA